MNDAAWCRARLDQLEERLLGLTQVQKGSDHDLQEAQAVWNDAAARELFPRYLDPYRQDAEAVRTFLGEQLTLLREAAGRMETADEPAAEIQRLSEEAVRLRERAESEVLTAHRSVDLALDEVSAARHGADQAQRLLASI